MSTTHEPANEREPHYENPDAVLFDRFARSAGASLRSEAPDDGMTALVRRGNRQRARHLAIEIGVVGVMVLAGVALLRRSDDDQPAINPDPVPTTEDGATQIVSADDPRVSQWVLNYTGNPVGPASGEPVKFGVVMQPFAYKYALNAAATYLNEQAGGVGGRPVELDSCQETIADCIERFATDPTIIAVLENEWAGDKNKNSFADSAGAALAGRKPLHTTYSRSGTSGVAYYPTYVETATAMAIQASTLTEPGARVLVINATSSEGPDFPSLLADRDLVLVNASTSEPLVDTIRRAGAIDASAVVLAAPPFASAQIHAPSSRLVCDDLSEALSELAMRAAVIVAGCEPHEGWYKVDVGFNETSPSLQSGALSITSKMPGLGTTTAGPASRDVREVGALLAVIRIINDLGGPAQADPAALDRAMREFTGPLPLAAGALDCTPTGKVAERVSPGSCVRFVDVYQFVNGSWIDQEPIDLGT